MAGGSGVTVSGNTVSGTSGTASYGIYTSNGSGVVVSGNTVSGTASYGIYALGGGTVTVSNNTVSYAGQPVSVSTVAAGIYLSNVAGGGLVSGNVTHDNSDHGIFLSGTTTGVTVQGNTSYHNANQFQRAANGIAVSSPGQHDRGQHQRTRTRTRGSASCRVGTTRWSLAT